MVNVLKTLFKIKFELYTIDITGNNEITARWSMGMEFWPMPWRPNLMFTGGCMISAVLAGIPHS
jgi:hypothetical protein